jgi:hypothetical protein
MPEPIDPKFLAASVKSKGTLEGSLLRDAAWAVYNKPMAVAKGIGMLPVKALEGIGGGVMNLMQAGINIPAILTGNTIKLPGSTQEAPASMSENSDNIIRVLTLGGKDVGDAYKAQQQEKFGLHKNPDGTPKTFTDRAALNWNAAMEGLKEVSGISPVQRALSGDYPNLSVDEAIEQRISDGLFGVAGLAGSVTAAKGIVAGVPGKSMMTKQLGELRKGAAGVKTANDLAVGMGLDSGDILMEAGATGKSIKEVQLSKAAKTAATKMEPLVENLQNGKITTADVAIDGLSKEIRKGKVIDNKATYAEGVAFKTLDGKELYVDKVDTNSPIAQRFQEAITDPMLMGDDYIRNIVQEAQFTDAFAKLIKANPEAPNNMLVAGAIAHGALDAQFVVPLAKTLGLTASVATQTLVDHFIHSATGYGKGLGAFSFGRESRRMFDTMRELFSPETITKIKDSIMADGRGDLLTEQAALDGMLSEAASSIVAAEKPMKLPKSLGAKAAQGISNAFGVVQNISKLGTQAMLSYVGTPARNFANSHLLNDLGVFEDVLVDTARQAGGKFTGSGGVNSAFTARRGAVANAAVDLTKLLVKNTEHYNALITAIDAIPTESKFLKGKASQLFGGLAEMHATGANWSDATFQRTSNFLSTLGTIGELPMRRAIWGSRAIKNFDYIPEFQSIAKKFPEVADPLKRLEMIEDWATDPTRIKNKYQLSDAELKSFDQNMRSSISDAHIHTLKTQLSYQTEHVKGWLDMYHKIPFADAVLPAFPKMLFNTYRWVTEHNPVNMLAILDPEVRSMMMKGAEGGFETAAAQRMYAKYVSGATMMTMMYGIKSGQFKDLGLGPGARPYEIQVGDKTIDMRAMSPFDKSTYLADLIFKIGEQGKSLSQALGEWTPAEFTDLVFSQRRMGDIPIFGLEKLVQDWTSGDPELTSKRVVDLVGEYLGRFGTPFKNLKLLTDMAYPEDQTARDQTVDPLFGPIRSKIPGNSLPEKINPTTGVADPVQSPVMGPILNLFGARIEKTPKLLQALKEINYPVYRLVGNNGDPLLDREVAKNVGKLLQQPVAGEGSPPFGEMIASELLDIVAQSYNKNNIPDPVLTNEAKEKILNEHFAKLRTIALKQAYGNPEFQPNFLEAQINSYKQLDSAQKKSLLDELYKQRQIRMLGNTPNDKQPNQPNSNAVKK